MKKEIKVRTFALAGAGVCLGLALGCVGVLAGCESQGTLNAISVGSDFQVEYLRGEELNLKNQNLILRYDNGSKKELLTADMIEGFDTTTTGDKTLTINYGGKTLDVNYKVVESDFSTIYNAISQQFNSTSVFKVDAEFSFPQEVNIIYIQNNGYFRAYNVTDDSLTVINLSNKERYQSVNGDSSDAKTDTISDAELQNQYQYIKGYFDSSMTTNILNNSKKVSIQDHKYKIEYTVSANLEGSGYTEYNVTIISSFDNKVESVHSVIGNQGEQTFTYSYTGVPTVEWPQK